MSFGARTKTIHASRIFFYILSSCIFLLILLYIRPLTNIRLTMGGLSMKVSQEIMDLVNQAPGDFKNQTDPIYLQYKVENNTNIPEELRGGHPILSTRTYPDSPRKLYCRRCSAYIYDTLLKPRSCETAGKIKMLIIITTTPSAKNMRYAIRNTWLKHTQNNTNTVRYLWLLGAGWPKEDMDAMEIENTLHGDILMDDYVDSYFNLSIKVMSGFRFAMQFCKRAEFIMRSADDNFVNIPNVIDLIRIKKEYLTEAMFGPCVGVTRVVRDKSSNVAVTRNEWPADVYPPYCLGTTFVMSRETMKKLFNAAENVPWFAIEDAYFGEVCRLSGIKMKNFANFRLSKSDISKYTEWAVNNHWRAAHEVSYKQQFLLWKCCSQNKSIPAF